MKNLISVNGKNAMKSPRITKGPERYTVVQLKKMTISYLNFLRDGDFYCTKDTHQDEFGLTINHYSTAFDHFLSWLEEQ